MEYYVKTSILEEIRADLSIARRTPFLIDIQHNIIEQLRSNNNDFSLISSYRNQFDLDNSDTPLSNNNLTNIIYIDAKPDTKSQLLQSIHLMVGAQLRNKLRIDALLKLASIAGSDFFGDLISEPISDFFSYSKDFLKDNIWDSDLIESTFDRIKDLSTDTIVGKAGDTTELKCRELSISQGFGNKLFLTTEAEERLLELAASLSSQETLHQIMEYTYELLSTLSLGAPKLVVVNNPQFLDPASISILSIIFSYAKDKKQQHDILAIDNSEAFNGISVVLQYTEMEIDETSETYQCIQQLKNMAQRYDMLKKIGCVTPFSAIRSTTFIGRTTELKELSCAHDFFCKYINTDGDYQPSQWTLIKGDTGVGKTALVNQHLKLLRVHKGLPNNHIKLRLLNQDHQSSEATGLATLQHSINSELKRLIKNLQLNRNLIARTIKNKILSSQQDFMILRNKAVSWNRKLEKTSKYVANTLGYSGFYKAAKSGYQSAMLDKEILRVHRIPDKKKGQNKKSKEFDLLDEGLELLHLASKMLNLDPPPMLLLVDDLQWIDELSSEYIITRFIKNHPSEIIFTSRKADSISLNKNNKSYDKSRPYTASIFVKLGLIKTELEFSQNLPLSKINNVLVQKEIYIKGFNLDNLSDLIKRTFLNTTKESSELIGSYIMSALSSDLYDVDKNVNTLFLTETLNLISDKHFYQDKLKNLKPIFVELRHGVHYLTTNDKKEITSNLNAIFNHLKKVHSLSYSRINDNQLASHGFTLGSYAVIEEKIRLIHKYFAEHGDIIIFALQLSVLLGTPFDSEQVKYLIIELRKKQNESNNYLKPLIKYLSNLTESGINIEHFDIISDLFEILKRFNRIGQYKYRHSLYEIFLIKQTEMSLNHIFKSEKESIHQFLHYCILLMDKKYKVALNIRDYSPLNDPQLHISKFGFELQPELWSLELSDRISNYGTSLTNKKFTRDCSYLEMIQIIPLHEALISYLESKELDFKENKLYVDNLFYIAERYFSMNGNDNIFKSKNIHDIHCKQKNIITINKYIENPGIKSLEKVIKFIDNHHFVQDHYDSFLISIIILIDFYNKNKEYEKSLPLQLKLIEFNSGFSFDKNFAYIYICNNLDLYNTYIKLDKFDKISSVQNQILDTLEYLIEYCGDNGEISNICSNINLDHPLEIYPINNISNLKNTLFYVSNIFINTTKDKHLENSITKVLRFYNNYCFDYPNFFIEDYIKIVKLTKATNNLSDKLILSINEKTIEWYEQVREGAPEKWYETEYEYKENFELREDYFCKLSKELITQYKSHKPTDLFEICVKLIDIGFEYEFFESSNGLNILQKLIKVISKSKDPEDANCYEIFSCLIESNFDSLLPALTKNINFAHFLEKVYFNYVLPYTTAVFLAKNQEYVEINYLTDQYLGSYHESSPYDSYSVILNQLSLILILTGKPTQSSESLRLSLLLKQAYSLSSINIIEDITKFIQTLITSPLLNLEENGYSIIYQPITELNHSHHLIKCIFESVLNQNINTNDLSNFLNCKNIFETSLFSNPTKSLDTFLDYELYTLLAQIDEHCYNEGVQIQQTLFLE